MPRDTSNMQNLNQPVESGSMVVRKTFEVLTAALLVAAFATDARADAPYCTTYNGAGYCSYSGRVSTAYINSVGQVILYFDTAMPAIAPASAGIAGVTVFNAAIYQISENPDYGKALYASLLAAQARGATIRVQLWGVQSGYMKMDRIWVYE